MRGKYEIVRDILKATRNSSRKTSIVYEANLGFQQADKYLDVLRKKELLKISDGENVEYEITEKGREVLDLLKGLEEKVATP
ncbi:hypothetical protein AKJ54_00400 [candidate division MSBL1 archaeon SCGC-AAA382K21]|uniref:ArnR1-like winged helix-turn-helix domain-containing protein n=1 Tax=candidate division MSBL1 archaeon SCGC-AAA382K21 TaxID=1698283 RepID=A0A133VLL2_9EURY|nr:hypothetical protein AKJ54_00400 [candidate division MSBL1 archaeon SCGC-AAA382K21]